MKKKFLSLLVLLSVPVGVLSAATVNGNYETAKKQTNNYITRFTMHDNYIEMGSNVPYSFDGTNSIRSGFTNGGLINKKEVSIISGYCWYNFFIIIKMILICLLVLHTSQ